MGHIQVKARIKAFGAVKWIISPSASHTLFMKSAADAFPEAKVVASTTAASKFSKVCFPALLRVVLPLIRSPPESYYPINFLRKKERSPYML